MGGAAVRAGTGRGQGDKGTRTGPCRATHPPGLRGTPPAQPSAAPPPPSSLSQPKDTGTGRSGRGAAPAVPPPPSAASLSGAAELPGARPRSAGARGAPARLWARVVPCPAQLLPLRSPRPRPISPRTPSPSPRALPRPPALCQSKHKAIKQLRIYLSREKKAWLLHGTEVRPLPFSIKTSGRLESTRRPPRALCWHKGVQQPSGEEEGKAISSLCQGVERRLNQATARVSCTAPPAGTGAFPHAPVRVQLSLCVVPHRSAAVGGGKTQLPEGKSSDTSFVSSSADGLRVSPVSYCKFWSLIG